MFNEIKQDIIEHKLNQRIIAVVSEILIVLDLIVDGLYLEEKLKKIIHYSDQFTFLKNMQGNQSLCKLAV